MPATNSERSVDDVARVGAEVYDRRVRPSLRPEDDGKFVAIDIESGEYEIGANDYSAVMGLRARKPTAQIWLVRAGRRATYKMRHHR